MIFKFNNLCKIVVLLIYFVTVVLGSCNISFPSNHLLKPSLKKQIGSRIRKMSNNFGYFILQNNHKIVASCYNKFEQPQIYQENKQLNISCFINYLFINGKMNEYNRIYLECALLKWKLYELSAPHDWCPSHTASYILANSNHTSAYRNLAGICYDTDNMTLSSIYYTIAPTHFAHMSPCAINVQKRMKELYVSEIFESKNVTSENFDGKQFQNWIKAINYQYDSIIQNPNLYNITYKKFSQLLDFQWWSNLRLFNWHFYEEALAQHVEKRGISYDILAGIDGVVMAPVLESCEYNYTMKNLIDKSNSAIPLYVWNYLQPRLQNVEYPEIVIIGFNSPFNEFYAETDVVFCQDICHKIDWLQNVRSIFRYNTMGTVFCCSVEEVRSSNRLNGFPQYMTTQECYTGTETETETATTQCDEDELEITADHSTVRYSVEDTGPTYVTDEEDTRPTYATDEEDTGPIYVKNEEDTGPIYLNNYWLSEEVDDSSGVTRYRW